MEALKGTVKDDLKSECSFCKISLIQNKNIKGRAITNINGEFEISAVSIGYYDIIISDFLINDTTIKNMVIKTDTITYLKIELPPCKFDKKNKVCPICNAYSRVVPIIYGYVVEPKFPIHEVLDGSGYTWRRKDDDTIPNIKLEDKTYYSGGCYVTGCDPNWYCNKCKKKF
ncbi:MAG: hypothetical protein P8I93_05285 [Crocinitomicaceae bacterium]|nr:hypothetical protein [Crocinitomicaceae bacterium]